MVMTTLADPGVHPNGSRRPQGPALAQASLIGKTLATARPRVRGAAARRVLGRAWAAFRPAALLVAGCGCATAATYIALGLWPGLLAAAAGLFLLDWLSKPARPPRVVVEDPPGPDGGAG